MPADRDAHVPLVRSVAPLLPDARGRHRGRPARPQPPPAPMPAGEIPVPLAELLAWAVHLLPAGFRGGMAAALFTPGGLHMGLLSLLSEDPSRPGPADREVIAAVTEVIAHGLDRTREIAATAQIVRAASTGVVLARSGHILPTRAAGHRPLAAGSRIIATAARELADSNAYVTPTTETGDGELVRVTALNVDRPPLDHLDAAVLLSPPGGLRGLTPLDLRLLGLLVEGATQVRSLAAVLGVDDANRGRRAPRDHDRAGHRRPHGRHRARGPHGAPHPPDAGHPHLIGPGHGPARPAPAPSPPRRADAGCRQSPSTAVRPKPTP
jgi:hypothetical protein